MDDPSVLLADTDETALIQVIRYLNPVVIVDESHHATSDLSVEMLKNFNPSFVFDLTATPKKKSNIIAFVDAARPVSYTHLDVYKRQKSITSPVAPQPKQ